MKLDRHSKTPFYRQIYDRFLEAITSGQLAPAALSDFCIECDCGPGLLLNFTNIPVDMAPKVVRRLARALRDG